MNGWCLHMRGLPHQNKVPIVTMRIELGADIEDAFHELKYIIDNANCPGQRGSVDNYTIKEISDFVDTFNARPADSGHIKAELEKIVQMPPSSCALDFDDNLCDATSRSPTTIIKMSCITREARFHGSHFRIFCYADHCEIPAKDKFEATEDNIED